MFFVSMKGVELSCTLPTWPSVHQTDDKSTSIMCTRRAQDAYGLILLVADVYILKSRLYQKCELSIFSPGSFVVHGEDGSYNLMLHFISHCCVCYRLSRVNLA